MYSGGTPKAGLGCWQQALTILNFDDGEYPIGLKSPSTLHLLEQQAW
ncbi:hypothetical protein [Coleofasciculus sp. FACHB-1120]|nr:hypothetical protein [Coleofasciculus sp. FACHB-1120]